MPAGEMDEPRPWLLSWWWMTMVWVIKMAGTAVRRTRQTPSREQAGSASGNATWAWADAAVRHGWCIIGHEINGSHSRSCDAFNIAIFRFFGRCCNQISSILHRAGLVRRRLWSITYSISPFIQLYCSVPRVLSICTQNWTLQVAFLFRIKSWCATDRLIDQSDGWWIPSEYPMGH